MKTFSLYKAVMHTNDANGIENSEDPDQSSPIWVCTVFSDLFAPILVSFTVA